MGTLYIVSTPIGNLEDITIRAIKTLFSVDIIACEDTRRTGLLLQSLQQKNNALVLHSTKASVPRLVRYDDRTENSRIPQIIEYLQTGLSVALVSDSGTPLISDPGYKLVFEALKRDIEVVSVPGPSAALTALTSSGLPTSNFLFLGFPPEKEKHRKDLFQSLITMQPSNHPTIIFYCAPHKLLQILVDMKEVFDDIPIVIARELTKVHEEIWKGTLSEAQKKYENPLGEFVVLFNILQA